MTTAEPVRERALHLVRSGRFDLAEPELRRALALDPEDAELHWLLSLSLSYLGRLGEGLDEANAAVALRPEDSGGHYARATALLDLGRRTEGTDAALEAVRLNPENAVVRVKLATAWYVRHDVRRALEETDRALALDPEYAPAMNLRAMILSDQGSYREAAALAEDALALEPGNSRYHANRGWALLRAGRERDALDAFREALRLDPDNGWAREGLLEALKAQNVAYRWLLRFGHWMRGMPPLRRWALLGGGFFLAMTFPPFFGFYFAVLLMGWIGAPLYNVALLADPFGRAVLTRDEKAGALAVAGCLGGGIGVAAWGLAAGVSTAAVAGGVLGAMSIPAAVVAQVTPGSRGRVLTGTAAIAAVGVAFVVSTAAGGPNAEALGGCYILGILVAIVSANAVKR